MFYGLRLLVIRFVLSLLQQQIGCRLVTGVEDFVSRRTTAPSFMRSQPQTHGIRPNTTVALVDITGLPCTEEGRKIFKNNGNWSNIFVYFNQCGWSGHTFGGVRRYRFRFRDSTTTNAYKHAGSYDEYRLHFSSSTSSFAGVVCIND